MQFYQSSIHVTEHRMIQFFKVIFFIWIHNCILLNALIVTKSKVLREENVEIEAVSNNMQAEVRNRRQADIFPPNIRFDISTMKTRLHLNLTRTTLTYLDIPVYTHIDDTTVRQNVQDRKQIAFYNDVKHMASIGVQFDDRSDDMTCRYLLNGHLSINGRQHIISARSADSDVQHQHVLTEVEDDYNFGTDYLEPPGPALNMLNVSKSSSSFSGSLLTDTHFKVELLAVCDYAVYEYWYSRQSSANTAAQKSQDAINDMKEHYAHVINAMNVIYGSITGVAWDIEIIFAGIYVATNPTLSPWSEDIKQVLSGDRAYVYGETALDNFASWLAIQTDLPKYDHAMAFTGYDLYSDSGTGVLGMAWVGRLCYTEVSNLLANSIQEDHLQARLGHVAAHELGHNLGARHDGQYGLNSCLESDKYVMAPSIGATTSDKAVNRYIFSDCSVDYFQTFITTLDGNSMNCMRSLTSRDSTIDLKPYNNTYNGRVYSVDEQCQQNFNASSSLCRYFHYDDPTTVCLYMYCKIPEYPDYCSLQLPWDGTSCGDGKWCVAGQCVSDVRAKSVNSACVLGDAPFCSTEVTRTGLCYNDYYKLQHCCDLCESYNTGISGCEYGDRSDDCNPNSCASYSSYSRDTLCCMTCAVTTTTITSTDITTTVSTTSTSFTTASTSTATTTTTPSSTVSSKTSSISTRRTTTAFTLTTQTPPRTSTQLSENGEQEQSSSNDSNSTAVIAVVVILVFVVGIAAVGLFIYKLKNKAFSTVAPLSTRMI